MVSSLMGKANFMAPTALPAATITIHGHSTAAGAINEDATICKHSLRPPHSESSSLSPSRGKSALFISSFILHLTNYGQKA
jgi:hypothetical protein